MATRRIDARVSGLVQGVFFRQGVKAEATRLNLVGSVRNRPGGFVLVMAEGEEEKLRELIEWCRKGTELTRVENIEVEWQAAAGEWNTFEIR